MKQPDQRLAAEAQSKQAAPLPQSARHAWTTSFVAQAPKAMPNERLKARAELVRNAVSSGSY